MHYRGKFQQSWIQVPGLIGCPASPHVSQRRLVPRWFFAVLLSMLCTVAASEAPSRAWLGVIILGVAPSEAVYLVSVDNSSPAADVGLRPNDLIVELDGQPVGNVQLFICAISAREPGTTIELTILRDDDRYVKKVKLARWPQDAPPAQLECPIYPS